MAGFADAGINAILHAEARRGVREAVSMARDASREIDYLETHLDKLTLITMAMWSLLRQKTRLTEEDLLERIKQIDLMDGVEDGKITRQVAKCEKCDRVMSPRHKKCLYCGAERLILTAFDALG